MIAFDSARKGFAHRKFWTARGHAIGSQSPEESFASRQPPSTSLNINTWIHLLSICLSFVSFIQHPFYPSLDLSFSCYFTAVYCDLLQFTAIYCKLQQFTAIYCNLLQFTANYSKLLHFTAFYCILQHFTAIHIAVNPILIIFIYFF